MLILSRRENETIVFPNLDIEVHIVRLAGKIVRIGVEAPKDVRVLRGELVAEDDSATPNTQLDRHAIRNRLNKAMLGLQVLQASVEAGQAADSESLIYQVFQALHEINDLIEDPTPAPASQDRLSTNGRTDGPQTLRALIVDDSPNEAGLLAQFLSLKGYTPHIVSNGFEAMRWLDHNQRPDVVLMDMNMPEMDGPATVRAIRDQRRFDDVHLFGVSGLRQRDVNLQTGPGGVDRWFQKPVDAAAIASAIRTYHRN